MCPPCRPNRVWTPRAWRRSATSAARVGPPSGESTAFITASSLLCHRIAPAHPRAASTLKWTGSGRIVAAACYDGVRTRVTSWEHPARAMGQGSMNRLLTVADVLAAQARLQPDKVGARDSRRALSFRNWHERANRLANGLHGLGLQRGDHVALLAYNCLEWLELYVALARAGLVAVPINFRLLGSEIRYIAQHCEARAFVVQGDLLERVETIRDQLDIPPQRFIQFGASAAPAGWSSYESI